MAIVCRTSLCRRAGAVSGNYRNLRCSVHPAVQAYHLGFMRNRVGDSPSADGEPTNIR